MQEKEIGKNLYEYRLSLSYENPIEAQAIRLIRERDRLEYPTIKLYLLKKLLGTGRGTEGLEFTGERMQTLKELADEINKLKKEVEEIKNCKNTMQMKEIPSMPEGVLSSQEEVAGGQMDLSEFDDIAEDLLSSME